MVLACAAAVAAGPASAAPVVPEAWEYAQEITVPASGLVEAAVPAELLDRGLPGQEDLRLLDGAGSEVPFAFRAEGTPVPAPGAPAAAIEVGLAGTEDSTVGVYRVATRGAVDVVSISTPAREFVKPVTVEASDDRARWRPLAVRFPVFRQADGAERLDIRVPPGVYPFLRVTVGDARERPIPLAGVATRPVPAPPRDLETVSVTPSAVSSAGGATRIAFTLPARNLTLHHVTLAPEDPVFSREVTVALRTMADGEVTERVLARGRIHRVDLAGAERSEVLSIPVGARSLGSRSLVVSVEDGDSPPLQLRRPVELALEPVVIRFMGRAGERYRMVAGNRGARAPRYDLTALPGLGRLPVAGRAVPGALVRNPDYRPAEPARGVPAEGRAIDAAQWARRRRVIGPCATVLALEVPPEVLSRSPGLADLRLVVEDRQVPYIVERATLVRRAPLPLEALAPGRGPGVSRWRGRLPAPGLPVDLVRCTVADPVFRRGVTLAEEASAERGGSRRLAGAVWERRGGDGTGEFVLPLQGRLDGDAVVLEVDDGDNPPLALRECTVSWRTSRLLFKPPAGKEVALLYDNPRAGSPRYDLALLADELLAADAGAATLAPEEAGGRGARVALPGGWGRTAFWAGLGLVVAVLIGVLAKLLPSQERG
jgi:hypothetical protein